jgi:hypothetical protein
MQRPRKLPKAAVRQLIDYCLKKEQETGVSAAKQMKEYLLLMKKYVEYFFSEDWPEKIVKTGLDMRDDEWDFVFSTNGYWETRERFIVACLRRNITQGEFRADGFDYDFRWFGSLLCLGCVVDDATSLRKDILLFDLDRREYEARVQSGEASEFDLEMWASKRKPENVRRDKMLDVELRLYEEIGRAEGKICSDKNRCRCPYKAKSTKLADCGGTAKKIWELVEFYDGHWNGSLHSTPSAKARQFYHLDEPGFMDVTDYDDVIKACSDGRMIKIKKEYDDYQKGIPY